MISTGKFRAVERAVGDTEKRNKQIMNGESQRKKSYVKLSLNTQNGTVGNVNPTQEALDWLNKTTDVTHPVAGHADNFKDNVAYLDDKSKGELTDNDIGTSSMDSIYQLQKRPIVEKPPVQTAPPVAPETQFSPTMQDPASPVQKINPIAKQPQPANDRLGLEALILGMSSLAMPEAPPITDFYQRDAKRVADELFEKKAEREKQKLANDYLNNSIFIDFINKHGFSQDDLSSDAVIDLGERFKENIILSPDEEYLMDRNRSVRVKHNSNIKNNSPTGNSINTTTPKQVVHEDEAGYTY